MLLARDSLKASAWLSDLKVPGSTIKLAKKAKLIIAVKILYLVNTSYNYTIISLYRLS